MAIKNNKKHPALQRNSIIKYIGHFLDMLGDFRTYKDLASIDDLPDLLAEMAETYFGLRGLGEARPRIAGILGVILAVHTVEQVTGTVATFGMRLWARGKVIGESRGTVFRESPLTFRLAYLYNRLLGGRLEESGGYYFFESGRTWHCQTMTIRMDTLRTVTHLRSFSLPHREYYFDRAVGRDEVAGIVKGSLDPDNVPGFIGSINEFESLGVLRGLKQLFFALNWLLVDAAERDGSNGYVDYRGLGKNGGDISGGTGFLPSLPPRNPSPPGSGFSWPTTRQGRQQDDGGQEWSPVVGEQYYPAAGRPGLRPDQITVVGLNGASYPAVVTRIVTSFTDLSPLAIAQYYDPGQGGWVELNDEPEQKRLAREVRSGRLSLVQQ